MYVSDQVDPTCKYTDLVCIESFDTCINLCGGINLPKVISCVGTDGKRRRQLVKGKDDLRQDAVMQQVFVLVNRLLAREPATAKRHLSIRVYKVCPVTNLPLIYLKVLLFFRPCSLKVVPLTQRSGIVEWCEGTISLGCYLIGTPQCPAQGAHMRYHPKDWSNAICRKKLMVRDLTLCNIYRPFIVDPALFSVFRKQEIVRVQSCPSITRYVNIFSQSSIISSWKAFPVHLNGLNIS